MNTNITVLFCFFLIAFSSTYQQITAQHTQLQESEFYFAGIKMPFVSQQKDEETLSKSILDTLYSFPTPGDLGSGLVWDGSYLWHCDTSSIYKLTTSGDIVTSFAMPVIGGMVGGGLEWDGTNLLFADEQSATLYKINVSTGLVIDQFNLPSFGQSDPNGFGLAWDGQYLWHSDYSDSGMIYKLDSQNGQVLSSFVPPKRSILGITWVNNFLYGVSIEFALSGGIVYKFDPSSGVVLDSAFWQVPYPLGLTWDGTHFWNVSGPTFGGGNKRIYQVSSLITDVKINKEIVVSEYIMFQNFPNPFNPATIIKYSIPNISNVTVKVFDILGKEIETLVNEERPTGTYEITWYSEGLPSGVYFYRIQAGDFIETKKMVLMK